MSKQNNRDLSLDFLKGLAILLVVFFHNVQLNPASIADNLFMLAGGAAVPCFFLVSGALFFGRPFSMKKHIRRMVRFYLVMVAWRLIYLALYHAWGTPLTGSLRPLFSYSFLFQSIDGVETSHFWFMDAMLTVMLAAPLFKVCMDEHRKLVYYLMAVLFLFNQLVTNGNLLFALIARLTGKGAWEVSAFAEISPFSFRYSNYMLYYLLGGLLMEHREKVSKKASILMIAAGLCGLVLIKYLQSGTIRWQGLPITSAYYWVSTMALACGIFLIVTGGTSRLLWPAYRTAPGRFCPLVWFAKVVGGSTLGIFYLHIPLIFVLRPRIFEPLAQYNGWMLNLAESLLIVGIACVIIWIGRKIPVIKHLF